MKRLAEDAIIAALIKALREQGSWCGETHIQKAAFLLSHLDKTSMPFEFVLYKHGPFSFELRDELTAMRANSFVRLDATLPYGSRFEVTDLARFLCGVAGPEVEKRRSAIDFVAEKFAKYGVASLERLSTALYVTDRFGFDDRVNRIRSAKPHISPELAAKAVCEIDNILSEWNSKHARKTSGSANSPAAASRTSSIGR